MEHQLDIARIKQYNKELRELTDKSAQARAELEISTQELYRLCTELSQELGIQVTPQNLETVYAQCVEKIENTLKTGEEILGRIKKEEEAVSDTSNQLNVSMPENTDEDTNFDSFSANGFADIPSFGGNTDEVVTLPNMFGNPGNTGNQNQGFNSNLINI